MIPYSLNYGNDLLVHCKDERILKNIIKISNLKLVYQNKKSLVN